MSTPKQTCLRLLGSLEDLAAQEAALVAGCDFAGLAKIQERTAPLIEHLALHGPAVADDAFRARVRALLTLRHRTDDELNAKLIRARQELKRTKESEHRVAQIAAVYGRSDATARQLSAVG